MMLAWQPGYNQNTREAFIIIYQLDAYRNKNADIISARNNINRRTDFIVTSHEDLAWTKRPNDCNS